MDRMTHWTNAHVKQFAAEIKAQFGGVWLFVNDDVRGAFIDARVTVVCAAQDRESVKVAAIDELRDALRVALGVSA